MFYVIKHILKNAANIIKNILQTTKKMIILFIYQSNYYNLTFSIKNFFSKILFIKKMLYLCNIKIIS